MPIPPQPLRITCPRCHWSTVWAPRSDALSLDELPPTTCPRCGCEDLEVQRAGPWQTLLQQVLDWLPSKRR